MKNREIIDKVTKIAEKAVKKFNLELFDVKYYNQAGKWVLEIIIDNPLDYVSTKDCENVSREIESELDNLELIHTKYYLTVSSPGLDRPLRNIQDFIRFKGHKAKIKTKNNVIIGVISEVHDETITIQLDNNKVEKINYSNIEKANLEINF
ncbi:MAG: ribosome maturation factor [Thermosipho sp. (in: Bacteria)]|nr:ribosome maturation factor [Thermosipho sp. (in: thermotogales)]